MQPNNTKVVFDATAATYDQDRMRLIPGHEAFYRATLELIPANAKRIVDLGAGSGLFSVMLMEAFPHAELHLIDFSEPMLNLARKRLGESPRVHYHLADYTATELPIACDAVASSLSIHHLEHERKQSMLHIVVRALRNHGVFVNADHIAGPTPELEAIYHQRWLADVRRLGATEQQIADSLYRQQEDRRAPVDVQLAWMRAAGFVDVDCWYKASSFAVMTGRAIR